ncbi:MAG: hypothetical protein LBG43_02320 [Treponema sp.]|nr:hypothetical protein [Treponema sp.]
MPLERHRQDESGHYYSHRDLEKDKATLLAWKAVKIDRRIEALWFPPFHGAYIEQHGKKYSLVNERILNDLGKMYAFILSENPDLLMNRPRPEERGIL